MKFLIIILTLFLANQALSCTEVSKHCIEGSSNKVIDGRNVYRDCWKYEIKYDCLAETYQDYCQVIREVPGCEQVLSECEEHDLKNGRCILFKDTYTCGNLLKNQVVETKFLNTEYTITKDELDNKHCNSYDTDPNCKELESICMEGPEIRVINGKEVYKDCWQYKKKYACFLGSSISDCKEYEEKCTLLNQKCLSKTDDGICRHTEKQFDCMKLIGNSPTIQNCRTSEYCIGKNCEEFTHIPNDNMGKAINALSILSNLKKDFVEEECQKGAAQCNIFKGTKHHCGINILGARNCCKNKGWANDIKLTECHESTKVLAKKKEANLCHYIGSYCKIKTLGVCVEKKQSYCCFNSKIARIIHEQGREQLNIGWGSAKAPDCSPLTIEQLQKLDFSKIDLTELYSELMTKINLKNHGKIESHARDIIKNKATKNLSVVKKLTQDKDFSKAKEYKDEISRRINDHYSQ